MTVKKPNVEVAVNDLLIGDMIMEGKTGYKVTGVDVAACAQTKTHVEVNKNTNWCYDSMSVVEIKA